MSPAGVYAIVHTASGRMYVGSSVRLRRRWADHRRLLRRGSHSNRYLQAAWSTYGEDAFEFVLLEEVADITKVIEREQAWLDELRPTDRARGFNLSPTASSVLGLRFTPEQRERVAAGQRGRPKSAEHRANIWANRQMTNEHRARLAANGRAGRGRPKSPDRRHRIGAAQSGSLNHQAKLTEDDVRAIRQRLAAGERGRHLAAEFGVHESIVSEIKSGRRWRHVPNI